MKSGVNSEVSAVKGNASTENESDTQFWSKFLHCVFNKEMCFVEMTERRTGGNCVLPVYFIFVSITNARIQTSISRLVILHTLLPLSSYKRIITDNKSLEIVSQKKTNKQKQRWAPL